MHSKNRLAAVLVAAALAAGMGSAPAFASQPLIIQAPASAAKPGRRGLFNDVILPTSANRYGRKGAGISMAQQKRSSAKTRSVARNRKHHR